MHSSRFVALLETSRLGVVLAAGAALLFTSTTVRAADPYLVKDINQTTTAQSSLLLEYPLNEFVTIGSTTYFAANGFYTGWEGVGVVNKQLWKTDGTAAGTTRIGTVTLDSQVSGLGAAALGGKLFFNGCDSSGCQPWISDGTDAGTTMIANTGAIGPFLILGVINNIVYFSASSAAGRELWRSDGTSAGTQLVIDIRAGTGSSYPWSAGVLGSTLVFSAFDGTSRNLYASDGTAAGTRLLAPVVGDNRPADGIALNGTLLFALGNQLWKTDGTASGTTMVQDGTTLLDLDVHWILGTNAYFVRYGAAGYELWKTDGTAAGTSLVASPGLPLAAVGNTLFYSAGPWSQEQLWKTDGITTTLVRDGFFSIESAIVFANSLYFGNALYLSSASWELWKSDGTTGGTTKIGSGTTDERDFPVRLDWGGVRADSFVFAGTDAQMGCEPWISDGTAAGTHLLLNVKPELENDSDPANLASLNGHLMFTATDGSGPGVWTSDGTDQGTTRLAPFSSQLRPSDRIVSGNLVYYVLQNGLGAYELWRSDGTSGGTFSVLAITNRSSQLFSGSVGFRGGLFFAGYDSLHGAEPWFSDGTAAGTAMISDLRSGPSDSFRGGGAVSNGSIVFPAQTNVEQEVWKTDATAGGTTLLATVPLASSTVRLSSFIDVNGIVYFTASTLADFDLWRSDGTVGGTFALRHFSASQPSAVVNLAGKLFLFALPSGSLTTYELWSSDGTSSGTQLIVDGLPIGVCGSRFTPAPRAIYWTAVTQTSPHHDQLWRTDGTAAGTALVYEFSSASNCGTGQRPAFVNGSLYFSGNDAAHGTEPWVSDGTTAGTRMLFDVNPGTGDSYPAEFLRAGANVFFTANDGVHGNELWAYPLTLPSGDANGDGQVTVSDLFYLVNTLFAGGPAALGSADVNGDGQVTAADVFYLINYFFVGGPAPR